MKLGHWLVGGLTGLLSVAIYACAADKEFTSENEDVDVAEDDDSDDDDSKVKDAGAKKDAKASSGNDDKAPVAITGGDKDDESEEEICDTVAIEAKSNPPDILIVLDRSSSMVGQGSADKWNPSVAAVKSITTELNDAVNFGLMLFPAPGSMAGVAQGILDGLGLGAVNTFLPEDTGCAAGKVMVPLKAKNAMAISTALDKGAPQGLAYTPTATSLEAALMTLDKSCADCAEKPTYVLLVTDGEPTCTTGQPLGTQADVDATNAAIDKLKAAKIKTFVVGYATATNPAAEAALSSFAQHGGTDKYISVQNGAELTSQLRAIAGSLVSCEYELNYDVEDPALVRVIIDGQTHVLNEGWRLEGRKVILEGACDKIKDAKVHQVSIKKECVPQVFQ